MDFIYKTLAALLRGPIRYRSRKSFPTTQDTITSDRLTHNVIVTRDESGIPHIQAQTLEDAVFAQGYVHAQDRLWQMELLRRAARGQLSEVFGPLALNTDRTARTFGFERLGMADFATISDESRRIFQAYIEGINFFLTTNKKPLPVEFLLVGLKPRPWELADSLALSRLMIWQLSHAWYSKLIRAKIVSKAGKDLASEIEINTNYEEGIILHAGIDFNQLDASGILQKIKGPFLGQNMGSNSLVVSGKYTESGKPLIANDVHLAVTTPSIWYLNHLVHPDNFSAGVSIPGLPMVMIGTNKYFTWTATLAFTDCADLFIEKINKEAKTYEYKGEQHPCTVITDEITVKDKKNPNHVEEILITRNGVIISDVVSADNMVISVKDQSLQPTSAIDGFFKLNLSSSWNDFVNAVKLITAPQLNINYADLDGNIGYWCTGTVPIRSTGKAFEVPVPGWSGEYDWTGSVPFEEMPHAFNPEKGFIVTANNKVISDDFPHYLGNVWMNGYRSSVITNYLDDAIREGRKITADMINDVMYSTYCIPAVELVEHIDFIKTTDSDVNKVQTILSQWDKHMDKDSVGAALYEVIRYTLTKNILNPTLGNDLVEDFMGVGPDPLLLAAHEFNGHDTTVLLRLLANSESEWIIQAGGKEAVLTRSIKEALSWLTKKLGPIRDDWHWGKIHRSLFPHAFDIQKPMNLIFNPKSIPMDGNPDTPKQAAIMPNNPYDNRAWAVSYRQLVDFQDQLRTFKVIIAPGQSGQLGHKHYDDLIPDWENGTYLTLDLQAEKYNISSDKLVFNAKK